MSAANTAPSTKAPASPAMMRATVASTSPICFQLSRISMVRQKICGSDGNRNGGMNAAATCHSIARNTNGTTIRPARRAVDPIPFMLDPGCRYPRRTGTRLLGRARIEGLRTRVGRHQADVDAHLVDRQHFLLERRRPLHLHAKPLVRADQLGHRLLGLGRALGDDQLAGLV